MGQRNDSGRQKDAWVNKLLSLEQAILDGQNLSADELRVIPAEVRKRSPLLLQAECEDGLLQGRLIETKHLLETALKGFAAQANESAMLAMMGMLGLLYEQVGDRNESVPIVTLLLQEWQRTPEACSGFVPWALARASANRGLPGATDFQDPETLFRHAAEQFGNEGKPLWTAFVMLDRLLYDPSAAAYGRPEWRTRLQWLNRHLDKDNLGVALIATLTTGHPSVKEVASLPERYAYLVKAILLKTGYEKPAYSLACDNESQFFTSAAEAERLLEEGDDTGAKAEYETMQRLKKLVSTPAINRRFDDIAAMLDRLFPKESRDSEESGDPSAEEEAGQADNSHLVDMFIPRPASVPMNNPDDKWRIKLMGGIRFSTTDGSYAEPAWKRRRAGELLVYLLLQPGYKANREQIIDRVFGEGDTSKRSNQLYVTLHDLRHTLKEMGMTDTVYAKRGVIGLEEHTIEQIDVETYVALSRVGDQLWMDDREAACRLYDEALPLYGQLATELPSAEWLERLREQLLDRQTNMLKRIAIYYSELQDDVRAEQRLNEWIALRPEQEEAYETMIRHCLDKGHRAEAINWFKRLERISKEELGVELLEKTKRLIWQS
ncbi:AfsR/SARP family transcriptional regulator [Paenibacillus spongiae]|uniref:Bacterial transcriptional activator domain-containing protein n=1 Tax=Paenibacillus spongiae TaxID=2909671 RepID=A0ABY5S7G7_9BACL|nr:BTAD domain-containing putative transcriptional regulator [Paenibacillus spongiae]UVI29857.1 hypothetical protein L1F29_31485 [Paenibacillus spongiae]